MVKNDPQFPEDGDENPQMWSDTQSHIDHLGWKQEICQKAENATNKGTWTRIQEIERSKK